MILSRQLPRDGFSQFADELVRFHRIITADESVLRILAATVFQFDADDADCRPKMRVSGTDPAGQYRALDLGEVPHGAHDPASQ